MYCAVTEAFENPLKQQVQQMDRDNNVNNYKSMLENNVDAYQHTNGIYPTITENNIPFFTTQGNMRRDNSTTLSELKRKEMCDNDTLSLLDSEYSEDLKQTKPKLSHRNYINKFLKSITDDGNDMISLASSQDDELYDHIKSCKYCRSQINLRMKSYYKNQDIVVEKNNIPIKHKEKSLILPDKILGYNVKEIILIIVASIIIIFILDLLVRIGKRSVRNKNA